MKNQSETNIWSEELFESMEWHDCKIYAMQFDDTNFELYFDIDYILEWIQSKDQFYRFKIVPATMVFRNVHELNISVYSLNLQIQDIVRDNATPPKNSEYIGSHLEYDWRIETTSGEITFKSVGFRQYGRRPPKITDQQFLNVSSRGGISFDIN